jgi:hypothetical protein
MEDAENKKNIDDDWKSSTGPDAVAGASEIFVDIC